MDEILSKIAETLRLGQMKSGQGSYGRRAPAARALPYLREARRELRKYVTARPQDAEAWRLLSAAEESVLDYRNARLALERAMSLSATSDRKALKKLALLREYESKWSNLGLTAEQLASLGRHLSLCLANASCDHTRSKTESWLIAECIPNPDQVLSAMACQGGYCDCEVLYNVT